MEAIRHLLVAVTILAVCSFAGATSDEAKNWQGTDHRLMHTDIAIIGADQSNLRTQSKGGVYVDASNLVDQASALDNRVEEDIEEDDNDRFIASRKGKLRPIFDDSMDKADDWANEAPVGPLKGILMRKKRCGGNDDDDDDGDANRSRRARRNRRTRRMKKIKKKRKNKGTVTTVTRKVIHNGQVVSHTKETQSQQPIAAVVAEQQTAPVVQTISTTRTVQQVQPQPAVQQAQPVVQLVPTQPEIVQAQPAVATVVQQTVPGATAVQG